MVEQTAKTFTQEQVNAIVQERLARERASLEDARAELAKREHDIARRELALLMKANKRAKAPDHTPEEKQAILDAAFLEGFDNPERSPIDLSRRV